MVLKRADADIVAEEPLPLPGGYSIGPYISPQTVLDIPWALIDQLTISLGGGGLFSQTSAEPSYRISQVAEQPATLQEAALPPTGDRRDQAPVQGDLPVVAVQAIDWFDYWAKAGQGIEVLAPLAAGTAPIVQTDEEPDMGILGDIYTAADTLAGGYLPNIGGYGVDPGLGVGAPYGFGTPGILAASPVGALPAPLPQPGPGGMVLPPLPAGCAPIDPFKGYVLKRYCGGWKWFKTSKKGRKQLFTARDSQQLGALIGLVGTGKMAQTWIATHPS